MYGIIFMNPKYALGGCKIIFFLPSDLRGRQTGQDRRVLASKTSHEICLFRGRVAAHRVRARIRESPPFDILDRQEPGSCPSIFSGRKMARIEIE